MNDEPKVINFLERRHERLAGEPLSEYAKSVDVPDFITPSDIDNLTDEQLESLLNIIRVRRMQSADVYKRTMEEKEQVAQGKARDMLEAKGIQVWSELNKSFKTLEKLELRVNELRALRLQANLDW